MYRNSVSRIQYTQKKVEAEKDGDKDGKALYKLMKIFAHEKTIKNLRKRIAIKLISNKKDYLKWTSKPSYMSRKIFDNDLVAIRKNKVALTLNNLHTLECVIWN